MITFFLDLYDQIYNYLTSVNFSSILLILQITGWLVSILLLWLIVILLKRSDATWWVKERVFASEFAYGKAANQRWEEIKLRLKKGDEANIKLAVIEADNLMDEILKRMGLPGADMGERLKQIEIQEIKNIEKIWTTHKIRNQIVHEANFHLSQEEAETVIEGTEEALKELEYLS